MKQAKIRLSGNVIDISTDGKSATPKEIQQLLEPELQYVHVQLLVGNAAYDFNGNRKPIQKSLKLLYTYDKYERLVCGAGFQDRINRILTKNDYDVTVEDCNPKHPRYKRFIQNWDNVFQNLSLRVKQDEILARIDSFDRGIICGPTGIGKSFLYKAIALLYPNANIVITTSRKDIAQAIRQDLSKHIPNVGQVGGGMKKYERVTVCLAKSLHRLNTDDVDILIGEEAHELAAPSYYEKLAQFRYCRMYGFTATPTGRLDNADKKLESLFGPIIFNMSYQEAVKLQLVVPIHVKWLDVFIDPNPAANMQDVKRKRWGIWRNSRRNEIIANTANEYDSDTQVLIMVTTFDHAVYLRQYLPDFTLCYAERSDTEAFEKFQKNGMLPEEEPVVNDTRRQMLRKQFEEGTLKKVIATDVWSTGVSFNQLGVLIRADARGSKIMDAQIPGRVCRLHKESDKTYGLVIDCLDQFDPGFGGAARKRQKNYEEKGWIQELPRYNGLKR